MMRRFRTWLSGRFSWLDEDPAWEHLGMRQEPASLCTCSPATGGPRGASCPRCGGSVVFLSEHPTDAARRDDPRRVSLSNLDHESQQRRRIRLAFAVAVIVVLVIAVAVV